MDEFATELGGEIYYHHSSGLFLMPGVTNGELDPTVVAATKWNRRPENQTTIRRLFRENWALTGRSQPILGSGSRDRSIAIRSANSNTLFGGDRTGSHYFDVMENPNVAKGTVSSMKTIIALFPAGITPASAKRSIPLWSIPF